VPVFSGVCELVCTVVLFAVYAPSLYSLNFSVEPAFDVCEFKVNASEATTLSLTYRLKPKLN